MDVSSGCGNMLQGNSAILLLALMAVAAVVMICRKKMPRKNNSAE